MRILSHGQATKFGGETKDLFFAARQLHEFRAEYAQRRPAGLMPLADLKGLKKFPAFLAQGTQEAWDESIRGVLRAWAGCTPETRFWGWKEVHIGRYADGLKVLDWLLRLLPAAKFILLRRPLAEVVRSMHERPGWWRATHGEGEALRRLIEQQDANLRMFAASYPDRVWSIDYEHLTTEGFCADLEMNTGICVSEEDWRSEIDLRLR